jgi:V8-like Glu-specific endopeptidase
VDSQFLTGVWQPSDSDGPLEGRPVWRLNRDRQRVDGRVQAVTSVDVQFDDTDALVRFTSVVRYSAVHAPGDSGGAVIDSRTGKLIGIHFAGESVNRSYMCLAFRVFNALAITIDHA